MPYIYFIGEEALFLGISDQISNISFASPMYFDLIDADNNTYATTEVVECSGHIFGSITIPSSNMSYRYGLRGTNTLGESFSLTLPNAPVTFEDPNFEVTILTTSVYTAKEAYSTVKFSFANAKKGPSPLTIDFHCKISYPIADVQYPDGQSVSLGPLETKEISISVRLDSSAIDDVAFNMTLIATESCMNKTKTIHALVEIEKGKSF